MELPAKLELTYEISAEEDDDAVDAVDPMPKDDAALSKKRPFDAALSSPELFEPEPRAKRAKFNDANPSSTGPYALLDIRIEDILMVNYIVDSSIQYTLVSFVFNAEDDVFNGLPCAKGWLNAHSTKNNEEYEIHFETSARSSKLCRSFVQLEHFLRAAKIPIPCGTHSGRAYFFSKLCNTRKHDGISLLHWEMKEFELHTPVGCEAESTLEAALHFILRSPESRPAPLASESRLRISAHQFKDILDACERKYNKSKVAVH